MDKGPLGGSGWDGVAVTANGTGTVGVRALFAFYAERAAADDWTAAVLNAWRMTGKWTKTLPGAARASLSLQPQTSPRLPAPPVLSWMLAGSVP